MNKINFWKYQGAGNDFILIDARDKTIDLNEEVIQKLSDRKFGIGADGVMLLEENSPNNYYMRYYNPDGSQVGMCGNGSRCFGLFAFHRGIKDNPMSFSALDGEHSISIEQNFGDSAILKVELIDVEKIEKLSDDEYFLNTGVNHFIKFVDDLDSIDIMKEGSEIRYSSRFENVGGTNANFVKIISPSKIEIRTYERGVENETLACGTGATAAAIATTVKLGTKNESVEVVTKGGVLNVSFELTDLSATKVYLSGEAKMVFKGYIEL